MTLFTPGKVGSGGQFGRFLIRTSVSYHDAAAPFLDVCHDTALPLLSMAPLSEKEKKRRRCQARCRRNSYASHGTPADSPLHRCHTLDRAFP